MKSRLLNSCLAVAGLLSILSSVSFADSISPSTLNLDFTLGQKKTITKTVTVSKGTPTSSKVDVFFLADTTGSMGGSIGSVASSASSILSSASGLGDVAFGVGEYKDFTDSYAYRLNTNITKNTASVQSGIGMWSASGGADWEEAQIYALKQMADTTSWRSGSERLAIWFGDAPGHDPSGGATQASAIAALNAAGVSVLAIDVGSMNAYGQASAIASATGGSYYSGINTASIVSTISASILTAVETYSSVGLDFSELPAGILASVTPLLYSGSYDRSVDRSFDFSVTFTGASTGVYDFNIYGTVDRGRVATEKDHFVVTGGTGVPEASSTLALLGLALAGFVMIRRRQLA